jgi:pimeloyl-ACP methyl ester carboxylesterase
MAWYGRWLGELLDETVAGQAIVVGHSLGGAISLACNSPRVAGRVLVSTAGLIRLAVGLPVMSATMPWLLRPTLKRSEALLRLLAGPRHTPPATLVEWYTLVAGNCRSSLAPSPLPQRALAHALTSPRLVVVGEHDVFLQPKRLGSASLRRLGTDLKVVPRAGHLVSDEEPEAIASYVEEVAAAMPLRG